MQAKAPRFRLYRAGKEQGRRREKGEDCPSGASSADPDGDRGDEPNSPITAGASWFVLLAAEKNEHAQTSFLNPSPQKLLFLRFLPYIAGATQRRSAQCYPYTRTEKTLSLLPLPCPVTLRGGAKQNIEETVRSNGETVTAIEQRCLTPPPAVPRSMAGWHEAKI